MRSDQLKIHVRKRKNVFPIPHEAFHCVVWTSLSQESHTELHQMLLTIPNTSLSYPYPHLTPLYNWPLYIKLLRLDCPLGQESKNPTDTPTMTQRALKNWCKVNPQGWTTWLLWSWWGCDKGPCEMHEAISNQTLLLVIYSGCCYFTELLCFWFQSSNLICVKVPHSFEIREIIL